MAIDYMNPVQIPIYKVQETITRKWDYKEILSAASNGKAVLIPPGIKSVQVAFIPSGGGTGKIQTTLDPVADVIADDTAVDWIDWDSGEVSTVTQDSALPVSAIRQVNVAGTTKMTLIAQ